MYIVHSGFMSLPFILLYYLHRWVVSQSQHWVFRWSSGHWWGACWPWNPVSDQTPCRSPRYVRTYVQCHSWDQVWVSWLVCTYVSGYGQSVLKFLIPLGSILWRDCCQHSKVSGITVWEEGHWQVTILQEELSKSHDKVTKGAYQGLIDSFGEEGMQLP